MTDSRLDQLLRSCGTRQARPGFHSDVWNRIALESASESWTQAWKHLVWATVSRLSQPAFAIATCAFFIISGSIAGFGLRAETPPPEVRYIHSVSPFIPQPGR